MNFALILAYSASRYISSGHSLFAKVPVYTLGFPVYKGLNIQKLILRFWMCIYVTNDDDDDDDDDADDDDDDLKSFPFR